MEMRRRQHEQVQRLPTDGGGPCNPRGGRVCHHSRSRDRAGGTGRTCPGRRQSLSILDACRRILNEATEMTSIKGESMNPIAHFERNDLRNERSTRLSLITALLMVWTSGHIFGQSLDASAPMGALCVELNQTAMTQIADGKLNEAELALSAFRTSGADQGREACAGSC